MPHLSGWTDLVTLLRAFVQSYAFLAIGCLLGFAVFKKAAELHLD